MKERIERTKKIEFSDCGYRSGKGFAVKPKVGDAIFVFQFLAKPGLRLIIPKMPPKLPDVRGTKWTATMWIRKTFRYGDVEETRLQIFTRNARTGRTEASVKRIEDLHVR